MAIEITPFIGDVVIFASLKIWVSLELDYTHSVKLHLELPLAKMFRNHSAKFM